MKRITSLRWAENTTPAQHRCLFSLLRSLTEKHRDDVLDGVVLRVHENHDGVGKRDECDDRDDEAGDARNDSHEPHPSPVLSGIIFDRIRLPSFPDDLPVQQYQKQQAPRHDETADGLGILLLDHDLPDVRRDFLQRRRDGSHGLADHVERLVSDIADGLVLLRLSRSGCSRCGCCRFDTERHREVVEISLGLLDLRRCERLNARRSCFRLGRRLSEDTDGADGHENSTQNNQQGFLHSELLLFCYERTA